jgi:hypothetical protein
MTWSLRVDFNLHHVALVQLKSLEKTKTQDPWHIYDEKLAAAKEKLTLIYYIL